MDAKGVLGEAMVALNSALEFLTHLEGPEPRASRSQSASSSLYYDAPTTMKQYKAEPWSLYYSPIDKTEGRLSGYGRMAGQASYDVQQEVINKILRRSSPLPPEDQAILLGIARIESGYNPDAAAPSTSASGVFQFVKKTGYAYGLENPSDFFDCDKNIQAGVRHYEDNLTLLNSRFPGLKGDERASMIYALHHDGPSLKFGGYEIAQERLIPMLDNCRKIAVEWTLSG